MFINHSCSLARARVQKKRMAAGMLLLLVAFAGRAEMRVWTAPDGARFEAEFVRELFGTLFFETADGERVTIDTNQMVPSELNYIRMRIPPEVEVKFSKRTRQKERSIYARDDDDITIITGIIDVRKRSRAPYSGTLVADLYMIAKEVSTGDFVLKGKKRSVFPLSEEVNNDENEFRMEIETRHYREYNNQIRGSEFVGYILVVKDSEGRFVTLSTDIPWMTEEKLSDFYLLKVGDFFDEDCWEVLVPRPEYYSERAIF